MDSQLVDPASKSEAIPGVRSYSAAARGLSQYHCGSTPLPQSHLTTAPAVAILCRHWQSRNLNLCGAVVAP